MGWFKTIERELWGLFVDDNLLALLSVVWICVVGFLLHWFFPEVGRDWFGAVVLFWGLAVILIESALRGAHKARDAAKEKAPH
jgi:uncharacterized membrane protein